LTHPSEFPATHLPTPIQAGFG